MDCLIRPRPNDAGKYECHCSKQAGVHYISRAGWYGHNPNVSALSNKRRRLDEMLSLTTLSTESAPLLNEENTEIDTSSYEQLADEAVTDAGLDSDRFIGETQYSQDESGYALLDDETSIDGMSESELYSNPDRNGSESQSDPISEFRSVLDAALNGTSNEDQNGPEETEDELVYDAYGREEKEMEDSEEILKRLKEIEKPSRRWEQSLRYFRWKLTSKVSDTAFEDLRKNLIQDGVEIYDLRAIRSYLCEQLGIERRRYHCCPTGCIAYTKQYANMRECPHCRIPRYYESLELVEAALNGTGPFTDLTPRGYYDYIPVIERLRQLFAIPEYAEKMRYASRLRREKDEEVMRDIWDADGMKHWETKGFFSDERTVALQLSTDGVQLFRNSRNEIWPFLLIILNLDPGERYKIDNFLPLSLAPGPKQPQDIDSFLAPFHDELLLLGKGVVAYDAFAKEDFILKAYLFLVNGDTPGVSKMMRLSGHVAKLPCRACKIEGTTFTSTFKVRDKNGNEVMRNRTQYYYPLIAPQSRKVTFQQFNLAFDEIQTLRRTPDNYEVDGEASQNDSKMSIHSGVKGIAPLTRLPTISFPHSIPFDVMHLIHLGFVRDLLNLISGQYFGEQSAYLNDHESRMTTKDWIMLGEDMENARVPVSWGRKPENIQKYLKSAKAEELGNFAVYYMLPLVYGRVSDQTFRALRRFAYVLSVLTGYEIEFEQLDILEQQLRLFLKWFYNTFYKYENKRLPVLKYTVHALVHLIEDVKNWGPSSYFWQYPQERWCGVLVHSVQSRAHGSSNLSVIMHRHQLLTFATKSGLIPKLPVSLPRKYTATDYDEKLYAFLQRKGSLTLSDAELRALRKHYRTRFDSDEINDEELRDLNKRVQIYHQLTLEDRVRLYCRRAERKGTLRLNHLVCTEQLIDKNAHVKEGTRQAKMIPEYFYYYISYYCVHRFRGTEYMLFYGEYIKIEERDGLVLIEGGGGNPIMEFVDIANVKNVCALVVGHRGKKFIVDEREVLELRLLRRLGT